LAKKTNTGFGQDALCHFSVLFFLIVLKEITQQGLWESGKVTTPFVGPFPLFHRL
jgi:hypothetical protein